MAEKTTEKTEKKAVKPKKKEAALKEPLKKDGEEAAKPEAKEAQLPEPKAAVRHAEPAAPEEKPAKEPKGKKAGKRHKTSKAVVARGKRKTAVARATVKPGKGVIRVNRVLLDAYGNKYVREIIREPVRYVGPETNDVDISVTIFGGGVLGQAQAARTAIANALVKYFEGTNLREKFVDIDRSLIIEDTRRVESKKYRGPKARARFQKSYR